MTEAKHVETMHDRPSGKTVRKKRNKEDLQKDLQAIGVLASGDKKTLQGLAATNNIAIEHTFPGTIEGWENKTKGLAQILWELSLIHI